MMLSIVNRLAFGLLSGNVRSEVVMPPNVDLKNVDGKKNKVIDTIRWRP